MFRFFTYVNPDILQRPSYKALVDLLDNYEKMQGINEDVYPEETFEQDLFLDLLMQSAIGQRLYEFFYDNGEHVNDCRGENYAFIFLKV